MNDFDSVTWFALGLTATTLGLVASAWVWRRRGVAAGLRWASLSLLPLAAALTGTLKLLGEIGADISRYVTRLVFSPTVWIGFVVLGIAVVGYLLSIVVGRRGGADGSRASATSKTTRPTKRRGSDKAGPSTTTSRGSSAQPAADQGEDLDEIEAILRKHGIS